MTYPTNSALPEDVLATIPEESHRTAFRATLNSGLSAGNSEYLAFLKAYRAAADAGWSVEKDNPTQSDVHVDAPLGSGKKKPEDDEDKLYVPPVEVREAAKKAAEAGSVEGIADDLMGRLACETGVLAGDVKKVALYFAKSDPAQAWGMPHAMKWAGRVMRKLHHEDPEPEPQDFEISGSIVKVDQSQHLVFGWASITSIQGKSVVDTQGDIIADDTIEEAAYKFVLQARVAGNMHEDGKDGKIRKIGELVESVIYTPEKVASMLQSLQTQNIPATIVMPFVGWWVGFKISDEPTWQRIVSGELKAFSVGGRGNREKIAA